MTEDRYPITPVTGNPDSVFIHFKGTSIRGIYDYDRRRRQVRLKGLFTDSYQLHQENRLKEEVGPGRLVNALARAKAYFVHQHQRA